MDDSERVNLVVEGLRAVSERTRPCEDLDATYTDGNRRDGFTYVTVKTGRIDVRRTHRREPDEAYTGALSEPECRALVDGALGGELWKSQDTRDHGARGETRPRITLGVDGVGAFTVQVWGNDADGIPAFHSARGHLLAIARRVSGDKVTY